MSVFIDKNTKVMVQGIRSVPFSIQNKILDYSTNRSRCDAW